MQVSFKISNLFRTAGESFRRCVMRFPVAVAFVFALTVFQIYLIAADAELGASKLLATLGYYFSVGTLLSLSLHLWAEEVKSRRMKVGVQAVAHLLLVADAFFLYHFAEGARFIDIGIAHGAGILALWLSVFFVSFFREKDDIPSWNFTQYAVGSFALVVVIGGVMCGGLCLLVFSLEKLFGASVPEDSYLYILVLCCVTLPLLLFLGLLPYGEQKHDRKPQPVSFLSGIIRYLFLPLAAGYLLVLYVYAARILVQWELPNGWVSWLVVTLMAGCIAIEYGLYPARVKYGRRLDERIARWLPVAVLPLLLLMSAGIGRRFWDYGITLNRLYLATLNAWFYFVCIGLVIGKARRIGWIPISFSLFFLLTSALPVNYASITRDTLRNDVKEKMQELGIRLPMQSTQYSDWAKSSSPEEVCPVNEKLDYLASVFGPECVADVVSGELSSYYFHNVASDIVPPERLMTYSTDEEIRLPSGYQYMKKAGHSYEVECSDTLSIPIRDGADSISLPMKALEALDEDGSLPPLFVRSQKGDCFLLTYFYLRMGDKNLVKLNINGYIFYNK